MNKFIRRSSMLRDEEDDEDTICERQALISDDELIANDTNANLNDIRRRQNGNKSKKNQSTSDGLELKNLDKTKDLSNEHSIDFTFYDIQPGDTLHNICLRYACSINQVKRLNGLINDQEFYGLRRLKLPLGKFRLLEDVIKNKKQEMSASSSSLNENQSNRLINSKKDVNSPGSALSISTSKPNNPRFRPLLSPGFSSDRIDNLGKIVRDNYNYTSSSHDNDTLLEQNSHSFTSLRELSTCDNIININGEHETSTRPMYTSESLRTQNFIKSEIDEVQQTTIDDILSDTDPITRSVFEDLDYHVEMAKAAAQSQKQRVIELVDTIAIHSPAANANSVRPATRVSKIPELFFSGENFGLNFKKLIIIIFIVCLVVPLLYINQINHVTRGSHMSANRSLVEHLKLKPTEASL